MPLIVRGNLLQSRGRVDWLPDGNALQPSLTFATDPDTGVYRGGDNELVVATDGEDRFRVNASGTVLYGDTPVVDVVANSTEQYAGSSLRLVNNAHPSTRKSVEIGTFVRDADANNSYFSINVLNEQNAYDSTAAHLDLSANVWTFTTDTTIRSTRPSLTLDASGNAQYDGSKITFLNNASDDTRRGATIGTFVKNADGSESYFAIDALSNLDSYLATLATYDLTDHRWSLRTQNDERLGIENDGNVLITGNLLVAADIVAFASDERLKRDLVPIQNALATVKELTGYTYRWRDDIDGLPLRGDDMGLLAQDVARAGLTTCVTTAPFDRNADGSSKSGHDYLSIQYNKLHALLVESIKQLDERLEAIENTLNHRS